MKAIVKFEGVEIEIDYDYDYDKGDRDTPPYSYFCINSAEVNGVDIWDILERIPTAEEEISKLIFKNK